ncbi:hypothetical protein EZI54_21555 [Marinobacter halodurans]|uniref:Lipoprotein n=1 Tax=Marinobacter halodurans TaxID=2528979 RepID=A0ABY1ZE90_9GAMM|nr:hypothetical protein [Marinobacter halodurans]TBW48225.1 hypothetical protein EZI54_21555 [Marinobacter halodurans]
MMRFMVVVLFILASAGCSNRGMYESMQSTGERECGTLPPGAYERCMDRYSKDYDEYERERKAL